MASHQCCNNAELMKIQESSVFTQVRNLHIDASSGVWETVHPVPHGQQATPCTSWALGKLWVLQGASTERETPGLQGPRRQMTWKISISILLQA